MAQIAEAVPSEGREDSMEAMARSGALPAALAALAFLERSCELLGEPIEPSPAVQPHLRDGA